jgi:hypothetical protein
MIWVSLVLGMGAGCLSFRVDPLPEPEREIRQIILCAEINETRELLRPGTETSEFRAGRDTVYCFLYLAEVAETLTLQWRWYQPGRELFRESQEVQINQDVTYLEAVTAYDKIGPESLEELPGEWSVAVFVNGVLLGRRSFQVVVGERPWGAGDCHFQEGRVQYPFSKKPKIGAVT